MAKLELETLTVESFETATGDEETRGTVAAHQLGDTLRDCPVSYGGTCQISICRPCW